MDYIFKEFSVKISILLKITVSTFAKFINASGLTIGFPLKIFWEFL